MQTEDEVESLEKITGQLKALHSEISILTRKSPNDSPNSFKLRIINSIIERANQVFGSKYTPLDDFDGFDLDDMPSNSDVVIILSQYLEEAERFRSDNIQQYAGTWYYNVGGRMTAIETGPPAKVRKK